MVAFLSEYMDLWIVTYLPNKTMNRNQVLKEIDEQTIEQLIYKN